MSRQGVDVELSRAVSLAQETSFRIGGEAVEYHAPSSLGGFQKVLRALKGRRPFLLGGGCNTLFPDGAFERPVISTVKMRGLEIDGNCVRVECGVRLGTLIGRTIEAGLGGLEGFVGIPGTVGGAVVMNAGGSGKSFGDRVKELGLLSLDSGEVIRLPGDRVPWSYRSWNLTGYAVGWVSLELEPEGSPELRRRACEFFLWKRDRQPLEKPSAGCIFKNPPGRSAAALIDDLGLKGLRRGGAMVSERHANFIVNPEGKARSEDVIELIREIQKQVEAAHGIRLETEIILANCPEA